MSGTALELGAGNGLNFPHYPSAVTEVIAVEPEPTLRAAAIQAAAVRAGASAGDRGHRRAPAAWTERARTFRRAHEPALPSIDPRTVEHGRLTITPASERIERHG
ncbi:MAG TPA: hypothetical protein VMU39_20790 [Solirubrobacteraceae bacterium]|nr:hypothetical protein [Solirubrobacteraceae bacterium]